MTKEFSKKVQLFYKGCLPERFKRVEAVTVYGKKYLLQPRTTDKYLGILTKAKLLYRHNGYYIKVGDWEDKIVV